MKNFETYDFTGKKVLIRVDFNVPLDETYHITDTTRIDAAIPTIRKVLSGGGAVILMSHLGRPKEGPSEKYSLKHLLGYLGKSLGTAVKFADDCIGKQASDLADELKPGEVLLLENLRFHKQEEKGDGEFTAKLAALGDAYVNDAFGTAHRAHASTTIIANHFPNDKMFGYIMENEVKSIEKVLSQAERPFTAILGGAKVSGKIEIIQNLLGRVDNLVIGGGMMFTFIKAMGGQIGSSMVEEELLGTAKQVLSKAKELGVKLLIPSDAIIADSFSNEANRKGAAAGDIPAGWMGLDIGPVSAAQFREVILGSKTILWNGPMGVFEMANFETGTRTVAEAVAKATGHGAFSLIGGGDSVAAIGKYGLKDKVSYVSTGGGAMLEYIEGKVLPGVEAMLK
jgi:phosphoglycerate kinase